MLRKRTRRHSMFLPLALLALLAILCAVSFSLAKKFFPAASKDHEIVAESVLDQAPAERAAESGEEPDSPIVSGLDPVDEGDLNTRFTKIAANGDRLAPEAVLWTCIHDARTDLVWEVKTNDGGWRDTEQTYTWFRNALSEQEQELQGSGLQDGGDCLFIACDTEAYQERARTESLCGQQAWRLPSELELKSLDHPTRYSPDIYYEFFPNTQSAEYWSSTDSDFDADLAWSVDFANGIGYVSKKSLRKHIRLVSP